MSRRYFVTMPLAEATTATLADAEAHHLIHVMRASVGDEIELFDGRGVQCAARVERIGRGDVRLVVVDTAAVDRELPVSVTLGVALPKGDRQRWLIEKATELGVTRLVPLRTQRGVVQPTGNVQLRLERAVIEASKQCGRNRLMEISPACDWTGYLDAAPQHARRLVAHPGAADLSTIPESSSRDILLAVGPEGGLTDEEVEGATRAGWQTVGLGPRILRVETAAMVLVVAVAN